MCTVVLIICKNVQTDSEVLTKLRIVQNLCFICFYQTYTVDVFTVLVFRDLSACLHPPKIRPTLFFRRSFTACDAIARYLKISTSSLSGFMWCWEESEKGVSSPIFQPLNTV
jgi:hypothetical protein